MAKSNSSAAPRRGFKEFIRKFMVSLKRSPQRIALVSLVAAFLIYSLNLSAISKTTTLLLMPNMGQCEFVAMLFSILAFVCFLRAFPRREKPKIALIILIFLMMAVLIFVDVTYHSRIVEATTRADHPVAITADRAFVTTAQSIVVLHIIFVAISGVLLATLPLYSKALRKINTSIDVADNGEMQAIDISGEE